MSLTGQIATIIGSRLKQAASFLFLTVFAASFAAAQEPAPPDGALSVQQARTLAQQAALQGNLQLADILSTALLEQDPDDPQALLVRAVVARGVGRFDEAHDAATRAYHNSDIPALRFDAAMLAADIQARREKFTSAQIWLRRADQIAPDEPRQRLVAQAYQQVTRRNPLQIQLRFSARPSNNVNNGAEDIVIDIGGLPFVIGPAGQQLGGFEAAAGASISYRLSESETHRTEALGEIYYRNIWLNSSAKAKAPGVKGSDFNYGVVIGGIRHSRLIWPEIGASRVTGLVGHSWYGGDPLDRFGELALDQTVEQGEGRWLNFGTVLRTDQVLDDSINSADSLTLSAELFRLTGSGGLYSAGASLRNVWSDSATVDHFSTELFASRDFARIGAIVPSVRASFEQRIYHKFSTTPDGRDDLSLSLGVEIVWPDINYYGFRPQLSLLARRTESNVDIYDRKEYSIGLSAVSRF
ncbi:MAG: surface lipoprotein assembly modifier [Boseongicola sp.]